MISTTKLLIAFALLVSPISGHAANHYINSACVSSCDGSTWNKGWSTFGSATWIRGDTYYVAGGIYSGNVSLSIAESGSTWLYILKANAANNSGDAGWQSTYATNQAIINGTLTINNSYISIDGITGSWNSGQGIKINYSGCDPHNFSQVALVTLVPDKSHISLKHIEVQGCGFNSYGGTDGIYQNSASSSSDIYIGYCWIHDVSRNGITLGNQRGTSFTPPHLGFLLEYSQIERTGGTTYPSWHGQGIQGGYNSTQSYWIIRNSVFKDIVGSANIAWLGGTVNSNIKIYNNILAADNQTTYTSSPGVIWANGVNTTSTTYLSIYNNTFYNITLDQISINSTITNNNIVKNNLFHSGHWTTRSTGVTEQYNDYYNNTGPGVPVSEIGQQDETSDPVVSAPTNNFQLVAGARAIGNGINLSSVFTTDIIGNTRPKGSSWDIGAYQFKRPEHPILH